MSNSTPIFAYTRAWFDFAFISNDVKPVHHAIYFYAIQLNNMLGWKETFGFPASQVMEVTGIASYNTYIKAFRELVDWGVIKLIRKSENQYKANLIALSKFDESIDKSLTNSVLNHMPDQERIKVKNSDSIDKPIPDTYKSTNKEKEREFIRPTLDEIYNEMKFKGLNEKRAGRESKNFFDYYESNGWRVGKVKMKKWKNTVSRWVNNDHNFKSPQISKQNGKSKSETEPAINGTRQSEAESNLRGF
ncbi:hypothetical protein [Leeuwenhoekiella sp. NPDC079379]|uniref:hypothetical protein n=1 Tax=Leeuwenhoekiella sp. NPDC079379 TaxID=3364122 RepID=UPI0037C97F14